MKYYCLNILILLHNFVAAKPFVGDRIVLNHHHNYEEMTRVLEETNQQCHGNICSVNGA